MLLSEMSGEEVAFIYENKQKVIVLYDYEENNTGGKTGIITYQSEYFVDVTFDDHQGIKENPWSLPKTMVGLSDVRESISFLNI